MGLNNSICWLILKSCCCYTRNLLSEHNTHNNVRLNQCCLSLIDFYTKKTPHLTVKCYREASFASQQIVRRPTDNQLSLSRLPSSDLIGPVRPHQWQHQAAALITAVRMKEARLMSSDRGMCTRDLDKKRGSIIAPRPPVSADGGIVQGNRCHRAPVMRLVGNMYITAFRWAFER